MKILNRPVVPITYVIVTLCTFAWLALTGSNISYAETKGQNAEASVAELINKLGSEDRTERQDAKNSLKKKGRDTLTFLQSAAKTADRKHRSEITGFYVDMLTDQQMNPENDAFVLDAINDEYYMTRLIVIGALAEKGYRELVKKLSKHLSEPAADDNQIFSEVISVIREKADINHTAFNPTMLEDGYIVMMGKKINSKLEPMLFDENENIDIRKKILQVYRQINGIDSNTVFLKLLSESRSQEYKIQILSRLNNAYNKNNKELINKLHELENKEENELRKSYDRVITDLTN